LNLYYYGGFFDLMAAFVNLVSPFCVYETRHLLGGIFIFSGLSGAAVLSCRLACQRAAFIAVALLSLSPLSSRHSLLNPKDAPLAWLLVWLGYYACRAIDEGVPRCGTIIGLGVVLGLAFGTRIMAMQWLCYIAAALVLGQILRRWRPSADIPAVGRIA